MIWKTEIRNLKDLKSHHKNPRKISKEDFKNLQKSIEKFGLIDKPILTKDGSVIGGHQRISVLKKMGVEKVECYVSEKYLTELEIDELNIRLNRAVGEWDYDILEKEWKIEDLLEWGFSEEELTEHIMPLEKEIEEGVILPTEGDPITKAGDLYELGNHRILCGNSTEKNSTDLVLNHNIPILMVTDPPYGVNYSPEWREKFRMSKNASLGKVLNDHISSWEETWKNFPGNIAYIWHSALFSKDLLEEMERLGFKTISQIIWEKSKMILSRGDYHWKHEPCFYFVRNGKNHNWQGSRTETTVWEIDVINYSKDKISDEKTKHSTQKPVECMARPIRNNSQEGDGVYEPFLGSGTTLVACEQLNRNCYAIELSPEYVDIAVRRWISIRKSNNKDVIFKKNGNIFEDFV